MFDVHGASFQKLAAGFGLRAAPRQELVQSLLQLQVCSPRPLAVFEYDEVGASLRGLENPEAEILGQNTSSENDVAAFALLLRHEPHIRRNALLGEPVPASDLARMANCGGMGISTREAAILASRVGVENLIV